MMQCHIKSLKLNLFNLFTYRGSDETMHPMINKLVLNTSAMAVSADSILSKETKPTLKDIKTSVITMVI